VDLFIPELQVLVWSVIVFFSLLALLWRFAWGPLMRALEERERRMTRRIEETEAGLQAAREKAAECDRRLATIKDEAAAIIAEGKRDAEQVRDGILAAAHDDAAKTLDRAKREIALARDAALEQLRDRVVELTTELAAQVIEREVKPEDHRRFIETGIGRIARGEHLQPGGTP
jgi:F-type H+-transporting ATPase subunit b